MRDRREPESAKRKELPTPRRLCMLAKLVTSWDGYYGTTWLYSFTDASGNVFIWKSSRCIEVKDGMKLKGSVKEHREYDGIKQTVMTRCSVA